MAKNLNLQVLISEGLTADRSMQIDRSLFAKYESRTYDPVLRIYSWARPSITLGYSQFPEQELDLILCKKLGIDHAVRPTGGGMVFHTKNEVAVSFVSNKASSEGKSASALLESTSHLIAGALSRLGLRTSISNGRSNASRFCFSYSGRSEVDAGGRKIVGIAQRVGKRSVLQQASIFVDTDIPKYDAVLRNKIVMSDFSANSTSVLEQLGRMPCFEEIAEALKGSFGGAFDLNLSEDAGLFLEDPVVNA
jgi:lipoate-protein ligase A